MKLSDNNKKNKSFEDLIFNYYSKKTSNPDYIKNCIESLNSKDDNIRKSAINDLHLLIIKRNKNAFNELCKYYKKLPPAVKLEDVYFKIKILNKLESGQDKKILFSCLINELYKTKSNNTTRSLIIKIFKVMESIHIEIMSNQLNNMLKEKRFSYKLKNKMKESLNIDEEHLL